MLDALLATIGTLGILASLLAKRGKAGTRAEADAEADADAASCETDGQDDSQDAVPALHGRRRGCPHHRVRARAVRGTGQ